MKNESMKKKIAEISSNKSSVSPTTKVNSFSHTFTSKNWERLYASSKQLIQTEHGIFHFEMYLKGVTTPENTTFSTSRVKVCPKSITVGEEVLDFFINPVDKIARCMKDPKIVVKWEEGTFTNPVTSDAELNPEEQFNKHKVLLENFIEKVFYPEILSAINRKD